MSLRSCTLVLTCALLLLGCEGGRSDGSDFKEGPPIDAGGRTEASLDADGDGLCDELERDWGTDPQAIDSDGDGLPDWTELGNGFDALDPASPAADQVALLEGVYGSRVEVPVRTTVEGDGQGLSGYFQPITPIYSGHPFDAGDFFVGAVAVSADPLDNTRGINYDSQTFAAVEGLTRLGFSLSFQVPGPGSGASADYQEPDCARAYPFRYVVKDDSGEIAARRTFLLLVVPAGSPAEAESHCLPERC
ncbi:MAG: thrombospondin type 3 repeat-containing protein [Myxococcales bacterium]|nr:thrombospondin type 3 repeat-containing protein [Myxococcales bacterium]